MASDQPRLSANHLGSRLKFETLIADTSAALFAAPIEQPDVAVERALERVRKFFQTDRCALLWASADQQVVNVRLASYAEGIPPVSPEINLAPVFPWSYRRLFVERKPLRVSRMADLPPEADAERETWNQMSIRSALNIPIETAGIVSHTIVLNSVRQECEWPDVFVTRLRVLGELLVSALERQSMFTALRDAEERMNVAADSAEAALWAWDYRTGVCWATERARTIFGYSSGEVITVPRLEASIHPDDRDRVRRVMEQSVQERQPFDTEYRILLPDCRMRWVASRGRPHFTPAGAPERMMGVSIDITEPESAQEELRTSEARLASGVELAGLGFYEVDFSSSTMYVDDRMRDLCGIPSGPKGLEALRFWIEHLHPDDRPRVWDLREQLQDGRLDRVSLEYRYLHPDRGQKWIHHLAGQRLASCGRIRSIVQYAQITYRINSPCSETAALLLSFTCPATDSRR